MGDIVGALRTVDALDEVELDEMGGKEFLLSVRRLRDEFLVDIVEMQAEMGDIAGARQTVERMVIKEGFYPSLALEMIAAHEAAALVEAGDAPGAMRMAKGFDDAEHRIRGLIGIAGALAKVEKER